MIGTCANDTLMDLVCCFFSALVNGLEYGGKTLQVSRTGIRAAFFFFVVAACIVLVEYIVFSVPTGPVPLGLALT